MASHGTNDMRDLVSDKRLRDLVSDKRLNKYFQVDGHYEINDGLVAVDGDCTLLKTWSGPTLPVKFSKVSGTFNVIDSNLETLEGSPTHVESFLCSRSRKLKTLKGGPIVAKDFDCGACYSLTSLKVFSDNGVDFQCTQSQYNQSRWYYRFPNNSKY